MPIAFASVLYSGCLHLDVSEKWLWAIDEKIEIGCNFSGPLHSFCECKKNVGAFNALPVDSF